MEVRITAIVPDFVDGAWHCDREARLPSKHGKPSPSIEHDRADAPAVELDQKWDRLSQAGRRSAEKVRTLTPLVLEVDPYQSRAATLTNASPFVNQPGTERSRVARSVEISLGFREGRLATEPGRKGGR